MDDDPYRSGELIGRCPRCQRKTHSAGRWNALACEAGCGEWYPKPTLEQLLSWRDVEAKILADDGKSLTTSWPWGKTRCPQCGREMIIAMRAELRFDYCPEHGVWLDAGELAKFVSAFDVG